MKGIILSFSLGAEIGILGDNGSETSSLLKIMADLDDDFTTSVPFHDPGLDLNSLMAGTTCDFVHPCFDVFSGPLAIFTQTWMARVTATSARIIIWVTNEVERVAVLI